MMFMPSSWAAHRPGSRPFSDGMRVQKRNIDPAGHDSVAKTADVRQAEIKQIRGRRRVSHCHDFVDETNMVTPTGIEPVFQP